MFRLLRQRRRQLGLSLEEVANKVGVSVSTLSRVERGHVRLAQELADALSTVLDVNVMGGKTASRLSKAAISIREALGQAILEDVRQLDSIGTVGWRPISNFAKDTLKELADHGDIEIRRDTVRLISTRHPAVQEANEILEYRKATLADKSVLQKAKKSLDHLWKVCRDYNKHPALLLIGLHEMLRLTTPVITLPSVAQLIPLSPHLVGDSLTVWIGRSVTASEAIALIDELNLNRTRNQWDALLTVLPQTEGAKALLELWIRISKEAGLLLAGLWVASLLIEEHSVIPITEDARADLWKEIENGVHHAFNLPSSILERLWEELPDMGQQGTWITLQEEW